MKWNTGTKPEGVPVSEITQMGPPSGSFDDVPNPEEERAKQYHHALEAAAILARAIAGENVAVEIEGTLNDEKKPDSVTVTVTQVRPKPGRV